MLTFVVSGIIVIESLAFDFFRNLVAVEGLIVDYFGAEVPRLLNFFQKLVLAPNLQIDESVLILVAVQSAIEVGLILLLYLVGISLIFIAIGVLNLDEADRP